MILQNSFEVKQKKIPEINVLYYNSCIQKWDHPKQLDSMQGIEVGAFFMFEILVPRKKLIYTIVHCFEVEG